MFENKKIECPNCGSKIKVWIDVDTSVNFEVSKTGKLSKRSIEADINSDGRCGIKCTNSDECDFELHSDDDKYKNFKDVFETAYKELEQLEVTLKRFKN